MADIGFDDIRPLFSALPPMEQGAAQAVRERAPVGSATAVDIDAIAWLAAAGGAANIRLDRPRIALFAGLHRRAEGDFEKNRISVTSRIEDLSSANDPLYDLCGAVDVDLRLYEMALHEPAGDAPDGPSLGEAACARAIAYGLMAVEDGLDIIGLAALAPGIGIVLDQIAGTLCDDPAASADIERVLATLADVGGHETAALFGALLAARIARSPVLLDGPSALTAAALLAVAVPGGADHCRFVSTPQTEVEQSLVAKSGLAGSILDGPSEGDGRGAARAILALRSSLETFEPQPVP